MIRLLTPQDIPRCLALAERAGWPREAEKWSLLLAVGRGYGLDGADGALSAMVVMPEHDDATFVAMMVVDPSQQGRGLGRQLLEHARAQSTPPLMLYATAAGRPLYEKLGFVAVDGVRKLTGTPLKTITASSVRVATEADWRGIVDVDAGAFGVRRTRLFAQLLPRAQRVVVDTEGGFCVRWFNGAVDVVGPVVARDSQAAIALVDAALEGCTTKARIDVADSSPALTEHLLSLGFVDVGTGPLMTWPTAFLPGDRARYHAIALQAFG